MSDEAHILVIDDNSANLSVLQELLSDTYHVFPANSGKLALMWLEENTPDLILLDIKMPGMDGFEVCRRIKQKNRLADVPIIFLSVASEIEDKLKGFSLGAVDFVTKPFHKEELLARAGTHLNLYRYNLLFKEQAAEKLIESELQLKEGERVAHLGSWQMETASNKCIWSDEFFRICGYKPRAFEPSWEKGMEIIHPDDRERARQAVETAIRTGESYDIEKRIVRPDGSIRWVHSIGEVRCNESGEPEKLSGCFLDITESKRIKEELEASLEEKELLLKEIHHRVKNSMQVVASLLGLQSNQIASPSMKEILQESRNRIFALSAVHEALYNSSNLREIDLNAYLKKVVQLMNVSYRPLMDRIAIVIDTDTIKLNIEKASPLGLIINELVSNSLKYAFPDDKKGTVTIRIRKQNEKLEIIVQDDGIGLKADLNWEEPDTLGLKLVRTLVEIQLDGTLQIDQAKGTCFTIHFTP